MEKKIAVIDVGSKFCDNEFDYEVALINNEEQRIGISKLHHFAFNVFTDINTVQWRFKSINDIPVSEIEEVRIAGYNNKVTLKVGDIVVIKSYNVREKTLAIDSFTLSGWLTKTGTHRVLSPNEYWYVNGKKYHRDDIIIPNHSGEVNEMIDHVVQVNEMVEITPGNIKEVLEYNSIERDWYFISDEGISIGRGYDSEFGVDTFYAKVYFESDKWLQHLELEVGKLKPLPKPQFDFENYILDNSHEFNRALLSQIATDLAEGKHPSGLICNERNAKVMCNIYKLLGSLE